ncbi:MAG TPA: LysR family transcriptional regulator [Casimicrobiaceae bacterium]|nr:LysR family transcriptional regulator [Casimicrobiaceae bacterium]
MPTRTVDWEARIGRRVKLRDLQILRAVVRWGSMAKAAAQLGMSQPSVSEAMRSLEDALGVRLLDRSPRGVEATIYARALLKRADVVFDELKQGIRDIEFLAHPTAGEVTIGCPESLAAGFVPAVIDRLSRRYPKLTVHVVLAQPGEQEFRELRERSVDLLLGRLFRPLGADDIVVDALCDDTFFVVAGAHTAWARRRRISVAELMNEPWILFPATSLSGAYIEAAFRAQGLEPPSHRLTSFSMQLRFHLLATGRFLTVLHNSVLQFNAKRWALKPLPTDLIVPPMPMVLFSLKNRTLSPVVQLFIAHAREVARSMPGRFDARAGS